MNGLVIVLASLKLAAIPAAFIEAARVAAVPAPLLYAIALTESGKLTARGHKPWPWTLNVAGQGQYFATRTAAWQRLQRELRVGRNVDIGIMQVSWRYHGNSLQTPWKALSPHWNLQVAAEFLRRCFERRQDWMAAVGCYHAPNNAARAARYRERVAQNLKRIARLR